jgi:hypothetical protein
MVVPKLRDRMKPAELLGMSGVFALFSGLVVLLVTREIILSLVFLGVVFIVSVVIIAMLVLAAKPDMDEEHDLYEQDHRGEQGHSPQ